MPPAHEEEEVYSPINIGIALSGGGFRAMLHGAGCISALDGRSNSHDTNRNRQVSTLGGLLQSSSYIVGVSGGSWALSSLVVNDFHTIEQISKWNLSSSIFMGIPDVKVRHPTTEDPSNILNGDGLSDILSHQTTMMMNNKDKDNVNVKTKPNLVKSLFKRLKNKFDNKYKTANNDYKKLNTVTNTFKETLSYYLNLHLQVEEKRKAKFSVSLTDYWGRALSSKLFLNQQLTKSMTISDISNLSSFKNFKQPFPIFISNARSPIDPDKDADSITSKIFEFSPFEFGSWDYKLHAFLDIKYLGSKINQGKPNKCVNGYDNIGFLVGTSSSLFNKVFTFLYNALNNAEKEQEEEEEEQKLNLNRDDKNTKKFLKAISKTIQLFGNFKKYPDYAIFDPNPFFNYIDRGIKSDILNSKKLYLVDGGEDGQNIPFNPLLQPQRKLDIILATDSTADLNNWPNGTTLQFSSRRYHGNNIYTPYRWYNGIKKSLFPYVPSTEEFLEMNLHQKPSFFGCDVNNSYPTLSNQVGEFEYPEHDEYNSNFQIPPLIVYIPNSQYSFLSNTSTFKLTYSEDEKDKMIKNGFDVMSQGNNTNWSTCIGCAILHRAIMRQRTNPPDICRECFKQYCWNPPIGII